jgi:propanediol utilization protein
MKSQWLRAIKDPSGSYRHFGIHPSTASLYGVKPSEIVEVFAEMHENQELPNDEDLNEKSEVDYWGWYTEKETMSLVYQRRFLLNMCFPYGILTAENLRQGKAYRLKFTDERKYRNERNET